MNYLFNFFSGHTVTRDQLGHLPAGPWADRFRPPPFDPVADIQQGGTGVPITSQDRGTQ